MAISAVEAILRSGTQLKGDILLCPVACHKGGGVGTRTLLENGIRVLVPQMELDGQLIITHGNGPVVGKILLRQAIARSRVAPMTLGTR